MSDALLTVPEAAARVKVSPRTMLRWLQSGKLTGAKLGRDWRIDPADLDRFIEASKVRKQD